MRQAWQVRDLAPEGGKLRARLTREVEKILKSGRLMPFRVQYGEGKPRNVYAEPWAMTYTLARAYPYLPVAMRVSISDYLRKDWQVHAPWSGLSLEAGGAYRQGDAAGVPELGLPAPYRRTGILFYALWLHERNTSQWEELRGEWPDLQRTYAQMAGERTYEAISGAIGMARLAEGLRDPAAASRYRADALRLMKEGADWEKFRANATQAYTGNRAWQRGTDGIAYPLFHLTPEVARYLSTDPALKRASSAYVDRCIHVWPLWWMAQAPVGDGGYFAEGCCAGPETRMMLYPYMAWVRDTPPRQLAQWTDVPDALIGDCYYIENLVTCLESFGTRKWE